MSKIKDKENFKTSNRKKFLMYKGDLSLSVDFSAKALWARRQWDNMFKGLKGEKKLSIKNILTGKSILQKRGRLCSQLSQMHSFPRGTQCAVAANSSLLSCLCSLLPVEVALRDPSVSPFQ